MKNSEVMLFTIFNKFIEILAAESDKSVIIHWEQFRLIL